MLAVARFCRRIFSAARRIDRNRLFQPPRCFNRLTKGARGDQAFAIGRDLFETEAGDAAQFEHHAFEHDAEALADQAMIRVT